MTERSSPWNGVSLGDAGPYSDSDWWNIWKHIIGFGASRANNGIIRGNGTFAGAVYTEGLEVTQTSPASAAVSLNPGSALVEGTAYINDSPLTLSIAANASGNPRIDTIILRKVNASQTVRAVVLQGTPAATPSPTGLTQNAGVQWEIPVGYATAASGFVTITNSVISPAGYNANMPDGIEIDAYNNSGSTLVTGTVVRLDSSANQAVTIASLLASANQVMGVWRGRTANGAWGRVVVSGIAWVRTSATTQAGDFLRPNSSVGVGTATTANRKQPLEGTFARVLIGTTGAGLALCQVFPTVLTLSQSLGTQAVSTGVASSVIVAPTDFGTGILEYELVFLGRSAAAATIDSILVQFNSDVTATNYYSEQAVFGGPTPTVGATENLGANAGIRCTIPGATATADYFGVVNLKIYKNPAAAGGWIVEGKVSYQIGNATTNVVTGTVGGRYLSSSTSLNNITVVTFSGSNLVSGSSLSVYGRQQP